MSLCSSDEEEEAADEEDDDTLQLAALSSSLRKTGRHRDRDRSPQEDARTKGERERRAPSVDRGIGLATVKLHSCQGGNSRTERRSVWRRSNTTRERAVSWDTPRGRQMYLGANQGGSTLCRKREAGSRVSEGPLGHGAVDAQEPLL